MPSDMTNTKLHAFVTEAGSPDATLPCPSCPRDMAINVQTILWMTHTMGADPTRLQPAEASHTVAAADGGKRVALECRACNATRNHGTWDTDRPTYGVWKRSGATVRAAREHVGRLTALGYPKG